ncbi:MAG TPA: shikimate dehydrogenase [Acidimicrobiales bacterium]|nr:shikimate dehydrogenase [Acidimicrobiales bacterium]
MIDEQVGVGAGAAGHRQWKPGAHTQVAAVVGDPVRHSVSPAMHNAAFRALGLDWVFVAFEVPAGEALTALAGARALGLQGLSVTMPHKADVAVGVDRLTPAAQAVGAVNTVVRRARGVLEGDNTDGTGLLDALRSDEGFDPAGRRCLVVGAGGAARAVIRALAETGANEVVVVNRSLDRAEAAAALAGPVGRVGSPGDAAGADLVVNATPVGMGLSGATAEDELPLDPSDLGPGQLVVDLIYHPPLTRFVELARGRGATAVNGLGMLVHQAARAFRLWTGEDPPLPVLSAAAVAALARDAVDR